MYIFDEWAADQDPKFKRVFYEEILPSLKAKNKAIVVISHDDRYFSCADHTIQLEDGQIIRDQNGPIAVDLKATAADGKAADIELHM